MEPPLFATHTYKVLWKGCLPSKQLMFRFDPQSVLVFSEREREEIEQFWQELDRQGRRIKDLPLYRLQGFSAEGTTLVLRLGCTRYKEYQGTNVKRPAWAMANPSSKMANPLAISAIAITSDGSILLQHRSKNVGEYSQKWHVTPSGHIHPPQQFIEAVESELSEELGVEANEIADGVTVTGLIVNKEICKPELTLLFHLSLSAEKILERSPEDRWEYDRLIKVTWEPAAVAELLRDEASWVPPGHAALLLGGWIEFGESWKNEMLQVLSVPEKTA